MRVIDLPPSLEGSNCVICAAAGFATTARLADREGGGVCYAHFEELLGLEARLHRHAHEEERLLAQVLAEAI